MSFYKIFANRQFSATSLFTTMSVSLAGIVLVYIKNFYPTLIPMPLYIDIVVYPLTCFGIWHFTGKPLRTVHNQNRHEILSFEKSLQEHIIISKTDIAGRITYANKAFLKISGYSAEELLGQDHRILNSGEHSKEFISNMWAQLNAGNVWRGRICNQNKSGNKYWVESTITPIRSLENQVIGFVSIRYDVTEQVHLEQTLALERAKASHAARLASLGELSAGIAHEINNPLSIIQSALDLLEKQGSDPSRIPKRIESIRKSTDRILKISKGLVKYSRTDSSSSYNTHRLSQIVSEALILIESKSKQSQTPIHCEIIKDVFISCDQIEIEQVLINLIGNAIDAVKNLPEKWIKISITEDPTTLSPILQVTDSGAGIPAALHSKIFDPFYTTKPVNEGTGLGLSISKSILDKHKASISILPNTKNTCFEICFKNAATDSAKAA